MYFVGQFPPTSNQELSVRVTQIKEYHAGHIHAIAYIALILLCIIVMYESMMIKPSFLEPTREIKIVLIIYIEAALYSAGYHKMPLPLMNISLSQRIVSKNS